MDTQANNLLLVVIHKDIQVPHNNVQLVIQHTQVMDMLVILIMDTHLIQAKVVVTVTQVMDTQLVIQHILVMQILNMRNLIHNNHQKVKHHLLRIN